MSELELKAWKLCGQSDSILAARQSVKLWAHVWQAPLTIGVYMRESRVERRDNTAGFDIMLCDWLTLTGGLEGFKFGNNLVY